MLNIDSKDEISAVHQLSRVISLVPRDMESDEYHRNISKQILWLLLDREQNFKMGNLGAILLIDLVENSSDLKYILDDIFLPFYHLHFIMLSSGADIRNADQENLETDLDGNIILVSDDKMEKCLIQCQLLLNNLQGKRKITSFLIKCQLLYVLII